MHVPICGNLFQSYTNNQNQFCQKPILHTKSRFNLLRYNFYRNVKKNENKHKNIFSHLLMVLNHVLRNKLKLDKL